MRERMFWAAVLVCVATASASPSAGWGAQDFVKLQAEHAERVRSALEAFEVEDPASRRQVDPESTLLAVADMAIARVEVRARPGEAIRAPLALEGALMTLDLEPQSYRAPDFQVELRGPGGVRRLLDPGPVRTLLGTIREIPGSVVAGSLLESGLEVMVRLPDETTLWLEPVRKHLTGARRDLYVVSPCGLEKGAEQVCGVERALDGLRGRLRSISSAATNGEGCAALGGCVADLICDTTSTFYQANNSNPAQVQSTVESFIALVNPRYAELQIRHQILKIVISDDPAIDPYADPTTGTLQRMSEIWGYGTHTSDLVHLFGGRSSGVEAGEAYLGGVCSFGAFGMYSYTIFNTASCESAGIVIHELGHSWGASDITTGIMDKFGNTCTDSWSTFSKNEISSKLNAVDGICLDLDNQPPKPRFSFSCSLGSCSFDASGSTDDRGIDSYSWSFGGGSQATTSHTYTATGAYTVTLTVTDIYGSKASTSRKVSVNVEAPLPAENYFAVTPCRIADTRSGAPLAVGQLRAFNVVGYPCGIPSTAKAVSFNVTADSPTGPGHLVFLPGNQASGPFAHSTISFDPANSPRVNNAILRLATNGAGTVAVATSTQVHLILDVYGYFSDATPAPGAQGPFGFQTLTPCRIGDTRTGTPIAAHTQTPRNFTAQGGVCPVPAGAAAAALNLTVISPTAGGHARLFQAGAWGLPVINFNAGAVLTNGARIRLAPTTPDVSADYFTMIVGAQSTHAVIDVFGYFKPDAPLKYRPITACRAVDTRFTDQGGPVLGSPDTRSFQIRGNCGVPLSAKAVAVNITSVGSAGPGYLIAYPSGGTLPPASYLTFDPGQGALGNGGIVALSTQPNDLAITTSTSTHVIIDVFGYFQ